MRARLLLKPANGGVSMFGCQQNPTVVVVQLDDREQVTPVLRIPNRAGWWRRYRTIGQWVGPSRTTSPRRPPGRRRLGSGSSPAVGGQYPGRWRVCGLLADRVPKESAARTPAGQGLRYGGGGGNAEGGRKGWLAARRNCCSISLVKIRLWRS